MILDSGAEIYVWVGKDADPEEKAKGLEMAKVIYKKTPFPFKFRNNYVCKKYYSKKFLLNFTIIDVSIVSNKSVL